MAGRGRGGGWRLRQPPVAPPWRPAGSIVSGSSESSGDLLRRRGSVARVDHAGHPALDQRGAATARRLSSAAAAAAGGVRGTSAAMATRPFTDTTSVVPQSAGGAWRRWLQRQLHRRRLQRLPLGLAAAVAATGPSAAESATSVVAARLPRRTLAQPVVRGGNRPAANGHGRRPRLLLGTVGGSGVERNFLYTG